MKRTKLLVLFVTACICALTGSFLADRNRSEAAKPEVAQDFTLSTPLGKRIRLSSVYKSNKITVVNFFATWCPPCKAEIPDFVKFYKSYKKKGVEVIGVDLGETPKVVTDFAAKFDIVYPILLDADNKVSNQYGIYAIPTTYIINGKGTIIATFQGLTTEGALKSKIDALL